MLLIAKYCKNLALYPSLKPSIKFLTDTVETEDNYEEEYFALQAHYYNNKDLETSNPINIDPHFPIVN